jgi:hypothetical protein
MRVLLLALSLCLSVQAAWALDCATAVRQTAGKLSKPVDQEELAQTLLALNAGGRLPDKFLTKREAQAMGWRPGKDLWKIPGLRGRSIGGDSFGNREGRLPPGKWREADLDYRGGKRGAKRLVYSADSRRHVTVDHYQTFVEIPPCR